MNHHQHADTTMSIPAHSHGYFGFLHLFWALLSTATEYRLAIGQIPHLCERWDLGEIGAVRVELRCLRGTETHGRHTEDLAAAGDWRPAESKLNDYLVVGGDWNMTGWFSHILGIIIQIDFHIFQRCWNHQPDLVVGSEGAMGIHIPYWMRS